MKNNISLSRFLPLYKSVSFSSEIKYYCNPQIKKNNKFHDITAKGDIKVSGEIYIIGICSGLSTKNKILDEVESEIKETVFSQVTKKIAEL